MIDGSISFSLSEGRSLEIPWDDETRGIAGDAACAMVGLVVAWASVEDAADTPAIVTQYLSASAKIGIRLVGRATQIGLPKSELRQVREGDRPAVVRAALMTLHDVWKIMLMLQCMSEGDSPNRAEVKHRHLVPTANALLSEIGEEPMHFFWCPTDAQAHFHRFAVTRARSHRD